MPTSTSLEALVRSALARIPGVPAVRRFVRRRMGHGPWLSVIAREGALWRESRERAAEGPAILMATSMGGYALGARLEAILATALTLRGARVDILLCDSFLPACQMTEITDVPPEELRDLEVQPRCRGCQASGEDVFLPLGLKVHRYGDLVGREEAQRARDIAGGVPLGQVREFRHGGLALGEHAYAGALRYFARGTLLGTPLDELVLRRYLEAALLSSAALTSLLLRTKYEVACFNHGLYVPQGVVGEVCRNLGTRVVSWNPAYRRHCFIFSHGDTYHRTMLSEPTAEWESLPWGPHLEAIVLEYLKSRWRGTNDWIWFHEKPLEDADEIARSLGLDPSKPSVALLSNVIWDAQLHYGSNAFENMLDWVLRTVDYFRRRPDLQLVVRAHPAEVRGFIPSRQPVVEEILRAFPSLPENVFLVPPDSPVSTYALVEKCIASIIYGTKTGIEIASMGIPVIVAGEAWIRGKGFSLDASSPEDYFTLLDRLPLTEGMEAHQVQRARKYAYHFFFRRMIPLPFVRIGQGLEVGIDLSSLGDLLPGQCPGLDVICDGILHGTPFVYPHERLEVAGNVENDTLEAIGTGPPLSA